MAVVVERGARDQVAARGLPYLAAYDMGTWAWAIVGPVAALGGPRAGRRGVLLAAPRAPGA